MSNNNDNDADDEALSSLYQERHMLRNEMRNILWQIQKLNEQKSIIEKRMDVNKLSLYKKCKHKWDMEPPQYQERTWYYCHKCENYK
jgi:hypothetical protein